MADLTSTVVGGGITELVRKNPEFHINGTFTDGAGNSINLPDSTNLTKIHYNGNKPLTIFELDFGAAVTTQLSPNEAIAKCINIIQKYATIVIRGDLHSTNQVMAFAVEQVDESLNWDGNGAETLVEQIEDEIIALGNLSGSGEINYTSVTCTVKTSFNFA
jgi:hypothetical protein